MPAQIAEGMNAANSNAKRLAEDANLLLNAGRFPSAASLAALSIEESGKQSIPRSLALAKDAEELAARWKEYRSHTKKNVSWLLPDLVFRGAHKLEDFRTLYEPDSDHPYLLDQIKQLGIYSDCLGKAHWSVPEEVIDRLLAESLVQTANLLCRAPETTALEIELWVKHMGPVWGTTSERMAKALIGWHEEKCQLGLAQDKDAMKKFVYEGLQEV